MKDLIGVIGSAADAAGQPGEIALSYAYETGKLIAQNGAALICGGTTGVMEAACQGASEAGGITIGYLPGMDKSEANKYVDIALTTGVGLARNILTVRAADAAIMISGGLGTLNELTISINERCTPVVVLEGTGGWSDRIREIAYDGKFMDERRLFTVNYASTPTDAVKQALLLCQAQHENLK